MNFKLLLVSGSALGAALLTCPAQAADLDRPYRVDDGRVILPRGHLPRRPPIIVEHDVEVVAVPVAPKPPFDGPYGPFTYFPTHYPNYGYGY